MALGIAGQKLTLFVLMSKLNMEVKKKHIIIILILLFFFLASYFLIVAYTPQYSYETRLVKPKNVEPKINDSKNWAEKEEYQVLETEKEKTVYHNNSGIKISFPFGWKVNKKEEFTDNKYWVELLSPEATLEDFTLTKGCRVGIEAIYSEQYYMRIINSIKEIEKNPEDFSNQDGNVLAKVIKIDRYKSFYENPIPEDFKDKDLSLFGNSFTVQIPFSPNGVLKINMNIGERLEDKKSCFSNFLQILEKVESTG